MNFNLRSAKDLVKRAYYGATDRSRIWTTQYWGTDCDTVCLCLGPYRNLTTLTGSILFLHPYVQVLNHAGRRVFGKDRIDFLSDYSEERLRQFTRFAIQISANGEKAEWGGSIIHSHAFEKSGKLREIFQNSDMDRVKQQIDCLFWKESLRVTRHIQESEQNIEDILKNENGIRFLMPIRNPMDCAKSNIKTGHHLLFPEIDSESTKEDVLSAILRQISWYADLKSRFPDRFFHFFEYDLSRSMLGRLASFLEVKEDSTWENRALSIMKSTSHYDHAKDFVSFYNECLDTIPFRHGSIRRGLAKFGDR
jgi:hypothetical protein